MNIKLNDKEMELLMEVGKTKEFYPGLTEDEKLSILRRFEKLGLIKWCPYPEEFYIVTSLGKKIIKGKRDE